MSQLLVDYKDEATGQSYKLDFNSGDLYDLGGTRVARWSLTDNKNSGLFSDYCADYVAQNLAAGCSNGNRDAERALLAAGRERIVKMDLGTGDVHQAAALPNYAAGYRNAPPIADMLSAPLLVNKPSDKYYTFAKEDAFQTASPLAGAPGAAVPEIAPRLSNATFTTVMKALGGFVSSEIEQAADAPLKIRQATLRRIMNAILLAREIRVANMLQNASNWNSANVQTILAAAKWNGGASSDPVANIHAALEASWGDVTGVAMSLPAYNAFARNPAVRAYYAYKNAAAPIPTPSEISALLQIPPIIVGKMQYMSSSTAKSYVWGNDVVLFRSPDELPPISQEDVATSYTFRWNLGGLPDGSNASGGFVVREFFVQDRGPMGGNKMVVLHQDIETMTSTYVGGLIKDALQ